MSDSEDGGVGQREVAYRLFAAEFEDADLSYSVGEDDRSPNYVVTPTGARVNRLFAVGVLTEVEQVSEDVLRGRVVDPTGAFVTYAGQYQPDVQAFLERVETPTFVAMTGKARTFQPEDSDQVYTSVRPESINEVDAETRDRWTVQAAGQTLDRIGHVATALTTEKSGDELEATLLEGGVEEALAAGIPIALDHYGTTPAYLEALRELALDAARVVAGERDEVGQLQANPDETGAATAGDLAGLGVDAAAGTAEVEGDTTGADGDSTTVSGDADSSGADETEPETGSTETASPSPTATGTEGESSDAGRAEAGTGEARGDSPDDLGDFDPEEFELDEETREQVQEEYGTEFQTGTEVGEPGDADIDTPESSSVGATDAEPESEPRETAPETTGQPDAEAAADTSQTAKQSRAGSAEEESQEPEDLQAAVVELMGEFDDGEGARRETLVEEMDSRYGVDRSDTEEAIQEALMSGECYEPSDDTLKPI